MRISSVAAPALATALAVGGCTGGPAPPGPAVTSAARSSPAVTTPAATTPPSSTPARSMPAAAGTGPAGSSAQRAVLVGAGDIANCQGDGDSRTAVEVLLSGHNHQYERFAPQDPAARRDDARGIRQFVVGTGGNGHYPFGPAARHSQVRHTGTYGVLRLDLRRPVRPALRARGGRRFHRCRHGPLSLSLRRLANGRVRGDHGLMCRSIKTLREPYTTDVTEDDVAAAALQYVRKISGFRSPAAHNAEAFDAAVVAVTAATRELLDRLVVRSPAAPQAGHGGS